jgi:hypothetical protein
MNQQDQIQDRTESLVDLPLTAEQTEQTKGGTDFHSWREDFVIVGNNEHPK